MTARLTVGKGTSNQPIFEPPQGGANDIVNDIPGNYGHLDPCMLQDLPWGLSYSVELGYQIRDDTQAFFVPGRVSFIHTA